MDQIHAMNPFRKVFDNVIQHSGNEAGLPGMDASRAKMNPKNEKIYLIKKEQFLKHKNDIQRLLVNIAFTSSIRPEEQL